MFTNSMMLIFGPKLVLSVKGIKTHSKSPYTMNGAFVNLLKFRKIPYSYSLGGINDFI